MEPETTRQGRVQRSAYSEVLCCRAKTSLTELEGTKGLIGSIRLDWLGGSGSRKKRKSFQGLRPKGGLTSIDFATDSAKPAADQPCDQEDAKNYPHPSILETQRPNPSIQSLNWKPKY